MFSTVFLLTSPMIFLVKPVLKVSSTRCDGPRLKSVRSQWSVVRRSSTLVWYKCLVVFALSCSWTCIGTESSISEDGGDGGVSIAGSGTSIAIASEELTDSLIQLSLGLFEVGSERKYDKGAVITEGLTLMQSTGLMLIVRLGGLQSFLGVT